MNKKIILTACLILSFLSFAEGKSIRITGKVTNTGGKGIPGVVVNDGVNFTTTDNNGKWTLMTDTLVSKFVSISTPAEYKLPEKDGLAYFYKPLREVLRNGKCQFVLQKRAKDVDKFSFLAISDPQVKTEHDMERWVSETVIDLRRTIDSISATREVVGMTLGDLVFDEMGLYNRYATSLKNTGAVFFQTIGNHDFNKAYQDLHNMRKGCPHYAEEKYHQYFGPTDYSFNIGKIHVISMKSINYVGHRKYVEALTDAQLEWLEKDLGYVKGGTTIFINMHAAGWNVEHSGGNIRNAEEIQNILKGYNVHFFCGHTHFFQNVEVSDSLYQHNISAACGSWWTGNVGQSGAPNGYLIVDAEGDNIRWHYKPTGKPTTLQMRIYKPGEFRRAKSFLVANVWDYDSKCKVMVAEDGNEFVPMELVKEVDEQYIRQQNAVNKDENEIISTHLFKYKLSKETKVAKVRFINRFGEIYEDMVNL